MGFYLTYKYDYTIAQLEFVTLEVIYQIKVLLLNHIRHIVLVLCMICAPNTFAQNLIKNPSFEKFDKCPDQLGNFDSDVQNWSSPTIGSTDYFNGCSIAMGTPKNFNGSQPADFGVGYAGLYLYAPDDYREYLQAELSQTLEKGKKYKISFYVSLAERSDFAIKEFGVLFSENKLHFPIRKELSKMHLYRDKKNEYNTLEISSSNFLEDTKEWVLLEKRFNAKGTENYITLGNFKNNKRTRRFKTKRNAKQGSYYYIDMVLLESAEPADFVQNPTAIRNNDRNLIVLNETHLFENVLFHFDKYDLLGQAKNELDRVYRILENDSSLSISIYGHTDSVGAESYNLELSKLRAKSVANYFVELGLSSNRIKSTGKGSSEPIASNASENGRKMNRRVEFVLSNKKIDH
ncbi:OmpA family protein [Maribacter sp. HTCC2170]|uniref:OmpA family protein n=1 Tax=Maribacter sp. (strain HTCC2170 / KCCM 42371) TaxID=313603 RepID=UPI00006B6E86|nr:OmpA family protein [Maribacter sp. HTCC2170]EAQ99668.1 OmpA/MotB [Maribacter sp. HTCC2170]